MNEERCLFCGEIIAEGNQVCPACRERVLKALPEGRLARDVPKSPKREGMIIGYRYRCAHCGEEVRYDVDQYCPSCGQRQSLDKWKERRNDDWKNT